MAKPIRLLLIEDDCDNALLVQRMLAAEPGTSYDVHWVDNLTAADESFNKYDFDVALVGTAMECEEPSATVEAFCTLGHKSPVVMLGAANAPGEQAPAQETGRPWIVCPHPVEAECLSRAIQQAMATPQAEPATAEGCANSVESRVEMLERENERLQEVSRTAQQFVDNVSHEFRTPLTVIKEFCSLTRDGLAGPVTDQQHEFLTIALTRIDDLAIMVDDMLDISKLEGGLLSVWRRSCTLAEVVDHVRPTVDRRAESQKITVEYSFEENLPSVYCDLEKTGRVIVNLAINAIKFCSEGGRICIHASRGARPDEVRISVRDNGPGISQENLQTIFERFRQVGVQMRSSARGFGLGLNIVKELVHLNLGEVTVESELGNGSTFAFTLPTDDPAALFGRFVERLKALPHINPDVHLIRASARNTKGDFNPEPVIDEFLQSMARTNDLVYHSGNGSWVFAANASAAEVQELEDKITGEWNDLRRNRPDGSLPKLTMTHVGQFNYESDRTGLISEFTAMVAGSPAADNPRVLLVDDDPTLVRALQIRLSAAGYDVVMANNGQAGLEAAMAQRPDAIVLDVRMPVLDGLETLDELKRDTSTQDIPVVMLSASIVDQQRALDKGARFFLHKPYDARTIISAIENSLSGLHV